MLTTIKRKFADTAADAQVQLLMKKYDPSGKYFSDTALVLQGTLFGEVRENSFGAKQNVCQAILNRMNNPRQYQSTIIRVCLARKQFSCWNDSDNNQSVILDAFHGNFLNVIEKHAWEDCGMVAEAALAGKNPNRILGAESYYARTSSTPWWFTPKDKIVFRDDAHNFVKFG